MTTFVDLVAMTTSVDLVAMTTFELVTFQTQSSQSQVTTLLTNLRGRSLDTFRRFISILKMSMDGWIADSLLNTPLQEAWRGGIGATPVLGGQKTMRDYITRDISNDHVGMSDLYVSKREIFPGGVNYRRELDHINDTYSHNSLVRPYRSDLQLSTYRSHIPQLMVRETSPFMTAQYQSPGYAHQTAPYDKYTRERELTSVDVPRHVQDLHRTFQTQKVGAEKTMTVLRQEEQQIKVMLDRNVREQEQMEHNHRILNDLDHKLQQIELDAGHLKLRPTPDTYTHRVPWATKTFRY